MWTISSSSIRNKSESACIQQRGSSLTFCSSFSLCCKSSQCTSATHPHFQNYNHRGKKKCNFNRAALILWSCCVWKAVSLTLFVHLCLLCLSPSNSSWTTLSVDHTAKQICLLRCTPNTLEKPPTLQSIICFVFHFLSFFSSNCYLNTLIIWRILGLNVTGI